MDIHGKSPKNDTKKTDLLQSQSAQGPMLYTLQVFLPMPSRPVAKNFHLQMSIVWNDPFFLGPMRGVRYRYNIGFENSWLKFMFYVVLDDLETANWNNQFLIGGSPFSFQVLSAKTRAKFQKWRFAILKESIFFSRHTHNSNTNYTKQLAIQDDVWILMSILLCYSVSWLS